MDRGKGVKSKGGQRIQHVSTCPLLRLSLDLGPFAVDNTTSVIARFDPISLAEMDGVKLQDRVDTKYVFSEADLPSVLTSMLKDYRLLEVDGVRGTHYRSLYFDTPDLKHY